MYSDPSPSDDDFLHVGRNLKLQAALAYEEFERRQDALAGGPASPNKSDRQTGGGSLNRGKNRDLEFDDDNSSADDNFMDEIVDIVESVVPSTDDVNTPALTFRVWIIGTILIFVLAIPNTIFTFRTNQFSMSPFIGVLTAYPTGVVMAKFLPTTIFKLPFGRSFTLNPGPFTFKEHALLYCLCSAASNPAYALFNIISQKYILHMNLQWQWCLVFALCTQLFGFGVAGLARRFLVRPAAMLWPANLSVAALLTSLHDKTSVDGAKRYRFFWFAALAMFVYQWLPGYIAPALSAVSIVCLVAPNSGRAKVLGSAANGVGFLSFTFDWSIATVVQPITTPLWALMNQIFGLYLFLWVLIPALWASDAFGMDSKLGTRLQDGPNGTGAFPIGYAMNTVALFDKDGNEIPVQTLLDPATNATLNIDVYNAAKPLYISTYFAVEYVSSFLVFAATITHVCIWYGKDIYMRFTRSMKELDENDVHAKMMDMYPECPDTWYNTLLIATLAMAMVTCSVGGFNVPWYGVIVALLLASLCIIPMGTIQAISGQVIELNVMSEFLGGFMLPGNLVGVMSFKTLGYMSMYQGINLAQDLKLGHYMKVPPRAMFLIQLYATTLTTIINVIGGLFIYDHIGDQIEQGINGWSATQYNIFMSAGAIWGAIGPGRFFGPGSPYNKCLYGFIIGLIAPLIPYLLHRRYPGGWWHLVNVPLIVAFPVTVSSLRSDLVTPVLIGFIVNYFVKRYRNAWWKRYAYVLSAVFDAGSAMSLTVIFFSLVFNNIRMPFWALNRVDPEMCSPAYFMDCLEMMVDAGASFDPTNVTGECAGFGMAGVMMGP